VVENLPCKCEALTSNPGPTKKELKEMSVIVLCRKIKQVLRPQGIFDGECQRKLF
jgi:hypothetical protein